MVGIAVDLDRFRLRVIEIVLMGLGAKDEAAMPAVVKYTKMSLRAIQWTLPGLLEKAASLLTAKAMSPRLIWAM